MMQLKPGEYDVVLNDVGIHYTVRGAGPVMIAHSGGPGMDARFWDDFAGIDDFVTIVMIHPRGSGLQVRRPGMPISCPITLPTWRRCAFIWEWTDLSSWAGRMAAWPLSNLPSRIPTPYRN